LTILHCTVIVSAVTTCKLGMFNCPYAFVRIFRAMWEYSGISSD
jgi:hypothetical protein